MGTTKKSMGPLGRLSLMPALASSTKPRARWHRPPPSRPLPHCDASRRARLDWTGRSWSDVSLLHVGTQAVCARFALFISLGLNHHPMMALPAPLRPGPCSATTQVPRHAGGGVLPDRGTGEALVSSGDIQQGGLADVRRTARTAADSSSDSNTGGSRRLRAADCAGGAEVTDAYERR
jgi:hypothetical protein